MIKRLICHSDRMIHQSIIPSSSFLLDKKTNSNVTILIMPTRSNSTTTTTAAAVSTSDPLQKLNHKDWLAPNEVLKIFKTLRNPDSVINVLERVSQRKDYKPNEALYTLVIQMLAQSKKFDLIPEIMKRIRSDKRYRCKLSDEFFYFVIKIYGNVAGYIDEAIKTLFSMPDYNCWPSIKTFNYVLNMLICTKQYEIVHEVYLGAPKLGLVVDACSLNILMKGLCENDKLNEAFELLNEYPKQGCRPNAKTYSTLMHCLCGNGRVDKAFQLLDRMEKEGCDADTITFNVLISGLVKQGRVDEGVLLLDRMKIKGCYPNSGSYQAVLYGIIDSKKFGDAKCFMDRMISEGFFPSFLSYKLVIEGLCKENRLEDVHLVLEQMVHRGFVPKTGMWKKIIQSVFRGREAINSVSAS